MNIGRLQKENTFKIIKPHASEYLGISRSKEILKKAGNIVPHLFAMMSFNTALSFEYFSGSRSQERSPANSDSK